MSGSTNNIFLDHIDDIRDNIYHSSKKIQLGINVVTSNNQILGQNLQNPVLKCY